MNQDLKITIGNYSLVPLFKIKQDNVKNFLGSKLGVYICESASPEWNKHFNLNEEIGIGHYNKKKHIFTQMAQGSIWISPISKLPKPIRTSKWENAGITYLSNRSLPWRFDQMFQTLTILTWLIQNRKKYSYYLVYNFDLPFFIGVLIAKFFSGNKIYVDYEDDYTKKNVSFLKRITEHLLRSFVDGAICIHEEMASYFPRKKTIIHNAFANLDYMNSIDFTLKEGVTFLYSGSLDDIRGVGLIPELVLSIKNQIQNFKIIITGKGPMEYLVKSWNIKEVVYLGFLEYDTYDDILKACDICLILQKPDHPFNTGSFPSKIEEYAKYQKPILILKKNIPD